MKSYTSILILAVIVLATSCKTEFEKIRTSNDPEEIYTKANEFYAEGDFYKAQTLYDLVIPFYRGKKEAESVFFKYAYCHYNQSQFMLSNHYFENYAETFVTSPNQEEAQYMGAYSLYKMSPNYKLDQTFTERAITSFQKFINTNPESERTTVATTLIDEMRAKQEVKAFEQGRLYYEIKNYKASINSLTSMIKDYPETKRSEEIRWLILDSNHILAQNSVFLKKELRFNETLKLAKRFIKKYPESVHISKVNSIMENCITSIKEIENVGLKE